MSKTESVLPILRCLTEAFKFSGSESVKAVTDTQKEFLREFFCSIKEADSPFLDGKADADVGVINAWLKERGFDIKLQECPGNAFSVAAVLDALVEWEGEASSSSISKEGKTYPAVRIKNGVDICRLSDGNFYLRLRTKSGVYVNIAVTDRPEGWKWPIHSSVRLVENKTSTISPFNGAVLFPKISKDEFTDIAFLRGLKMGSLYIGEAVQQNRFRMNEKGARAQSAAGISLRCSTFNRDPLICIDEPFLLWMSEPGKVLPLFCGWFETDSWKEPSDISGKR